MTDPKLRVLVTGAAGFLGWHLRCHALGESDLEVTAMPRARFDDPAALAGALAGCDVLVHLAGMNRGDAAELERTNVALADALATALRAAPRAPRVVYASTTHATSDTPYGRSKRRAGEMLAAAAAERGVACHAIVFPHLFGERGRPHYNSAVATFCHQLANGEPRLVTRDAELELLHAQDAAAALVAAARGGDGVELRPAGRRIMVSEVLARLEAIAAGYATLIVPDLEDPFALRLFNAYRSYLYPTQVPVSLTVHSDPRGDLFEAVRTHHGGQSFVSTTHHGHVRGNHYHRFKFERFLVLRGRAEIRIRRLLDDAVLTHAVDGARPAVVDIPTLHTHHIENVGDDDLITMFWAHEFYDRARPDTYAEKV